MMMIREQGGDKRWVGVQKKGDRREEKGDNEGARERRKRSKRVMRKEKGGREKGNIEEKGKGRRE